MACKTSHKNSFYLFIDLYLQGSPLLPLLPPAPRPLHLPPKGQQTVRYYGLYSNKCRGQISPIPDRIIRLPKPEPPPEKPPPTQILLIPAPPNCRARDMRPLWRDLILRVWGGDPLECPCCKGTMKPVRTILRREEIEFFLRLHGL